MPGERRTTSAVNAIRRCCDAPKPSCSPTSSRPIDRPFAEIHDSEELLFLRRTTGTAGNPAHPERVEITEYVGAKTGRRYACRVSETRPQECLEVIFPGVGLPAVTRMVL